MVGGSGQGFAVIYSAYRLVCVVQPKIASYTGGYNNHGGLSSTAEISG